MLFSHQVSKEKIVDKVYDNIMDIDIQSKSANINIIENSSSDIRVVVYSEQKRTNVKIKNNKLLIISKTKKCRGICLNTKIDKIEIYIPFDYKNKVTINNDAGDIKIGKFDDLVLDIKTDAGDIDIDSVKKANIKTDAGDIDINKVESITITSDAGDIKIEAINKYLNLKLDAGNVKIDKLNITKNSRIETDAGDIKIGSINKIYVNAKTDVGDIKIKKNYRKSDIELKIKTDVGDIKVKN